MLNFDSAYEKVLGHEGAYSNDSNDTGGETFCGVSRNNFPNWEGWYIVDNYKQESGFPKNAINDGLLMDMVKRWYKKNFWDKFDLDLVDSKDVSYEVFEQAVNQGAGRATKHIQEVCNAMNYKHQYGSDLGVDSKIGPATRARLVKISNNSYQDSIAMANGLNCMQGFFYVQLGNGSSSKSDYRKYMKGWLSRRAQGYPYTK